VSPFVAGIIIFVIVQSIVAANLVFSLRRDREENGKVTPAKLVLALLPVLVVDAVFVGWLLRHLEVF
jgi:hypothetical protein